MRWGRAHLPGATWVWDEVEAADGAWRAAAVFDGTGARQDAADLSLREDDTGCSVAMAGETLTLEPVRTLHEGAAFDAARFPNPLERAAARLWAGRVMERRRLSRLGDGGWAVHEDVRF